MTDGQNRLFSGGETGRRAHAGQLEDYAAYALALTELYRLTFETAYLEHALLRGEQMTALFEDKERGGYFFHRRRCRAPHFPSQGNLRRGAPPAIRPQPWCYSGLPT